MGATRRNRSSWVDAFWVLVTIGLVSAAYLALPGRYRMSPQWEEAALLMLFATVTILVTSRFWARKAAMWTALLISSAIHLLLVHAWIERAGSLSSGRGKLAVLLGLGLYFVAYGTMTFIERKKCERRGSRPPSALRL